MAIAFVHVLASCEKPTCEDAEPTIVVTARLPANVAADDVKSLVVNLSIDESKYRRVFPLGNAFNDGETSLAIALAPAPRSRFRAALDVVAVRGQNGDGDVVATATDTFDAEPNGCNEVVLALRGRRAVVPGLVAYYRFDEVDGIFATDSSTYGVDATIVGAKHAEGKVGTALSLDGKDDFAFRPYIIAESASIACWVLTTQRQKDQMVAGALYWPGPGGTRAYGYGLMFQPYANNLAFVLGRGSDANSLNASTRTSTGTWHHVAGTYDAKSGLGSLYVDGKLAKQVGTFPLPAPIANGGHKEMFIGALNRTPWAVLSGFVDELRFYDRAISGLEVEALYEAQQR